MTELTRHHAYSGARFDTYSGYACRLNQLKPTKPKPQPSTVQTDSSPRIPFKPHTVHLQSNPSPQAANPHPLQTRTCRTSTEHQNNPTKTHVTRHYPLQHQLEHGTTNRLLLHLLIRHIILPNHLPIPPPVHLHLLPSGSCIFRRSFLHPPEPPSAANLTSIY